MVESEEVIINVDIY